jgi:biopolymer transport protein ExbD
MHLSDHQQPIDDNLDLITTDDPSAYEYTDSPIHDHTSLSVYGHTDYSGSDRSIHLPPSSGVPSEVSSAVTSDSDLPPPPPPSPPPKSSKPVQQTGLLNFFSAVPRDEVHAAWGKRKRDNWERDEEARIEVTRKQEKWKQEKLSDIREGNRLSQQKRRKKIQKQEIKAGMRDEDGKKVQVSHNFHLKLTSQLTSFKVITEPDQEIQVPSRSEAAAASRPKKVIIAEIKRREQVKAGKPYKPSKRDEALQKTINWRSPTYWPMIEMAARKQVGKPNLTELVNQLRQQDNRFNYLTHRRISEWRNKSVKNRIEWSEETIALVKKEFLPGGHQTRYNVFVSIFK